jgi:hypothetical protein
VHQATDKVTFTLTHGTYYPNDANGYWNYTFYRNGKPIDDWDDNATPFQKAAIRSRHHWGQAQRIQRFRTRPYFYACVPAHHKRRWLGTQSFFFLADKERGRDRAKTRDISQERNDDESIARLASVRWKALGTLDAGRAREEPRNSLKSKPTSMRRSGVGVHEWLPTKTLKSLLRSVAVLASSSRRRKDPRTAPLFLLARLRRPYPRPA